MTPQEMAALHALCFSAPPPWSDASFRACLSDPTVFALTEAEGFLLGRSVAGEAEVLTLAVAPQARRRGMGARLVQRFVYQARLRGAQDAFLEVASTNLPAITLYTRFGFAEAGRRPRYYQGRGGTFDDALILRRVLEQQAGPDAT